MRVPASQAAIAIDNLRIIDDKGDKIEMNCLFERKENECV